MDFIIPEQYDGCLLRTYLQGELRLSGRLLSALKRHPTGMMLDGARVTVRHPLRKGSLLQLAIESVVPTQPGHILPVPAAQPVPILYEDDDLIVCAKPPFMPTHPSHGHFTDTLANALAYRAAADREEETPFVFHPINRLDRNTSGAVLVARHALAAQRLSRAMEAGEIRKSYLALLCGCPAPPAGEIITGIRRRQPSVILREVTSVDAPGAAVARTDYQTLATFSLPPHRERDDLSSLPQTVTLVRACPQTGRTHQLRLHFASLGTPILGDELYGHGVLPGCPERHALHSHTLTFPHPRTGECLCIEAPLPDDFLALLPDEAKSHIPRVSFFNQKELL